MIQQLAAIIFFVFQSLGLQPQPAIELRSLRVAEAAPEHRGVVPPGAKVDRTIRLANRLTVPTRVAVDSKTCACTEVKIEPEVVEPGAAALVTLKVLVGPQPGEQFHTIVLRSSWTESAGEKTETAIVGIRYESDVPYYIDPDSAGAAVIAGDQARVWTFVRVLALEDGEPFTLDPQESEEKHWNTTRVTVGGIPPGVVAITATATFMQEGVFDDALVLKTGSARMPTIKVPVRAHVLSRWKVFPGGAAFSTRSDQHATLRLTPRRDGLPDPANIVFTHKPEWIEAELKERSIVVRFRPNPSTPDAGSTRLRVNAADGTQLADIPVSWFFASPASATR